MLVLAPDPRLGIAPERVARVRALLESARSTSGATAVPGVVVALPGGPDGVLDAVVLRPDGVLGLVPTSVPTSVRVAAGSGSGEPGESSADAVDDGAADDELERLLALPDPAITAPRRALPAADPGPEATLSALVAPVGSFRTLDAADVRRVLDAFRLGDHTPAAAELAAAGFPEQQPTGEALDDGETTAMPAVAEAPVIPRARAARPGPSASGPHASSRPATRSSPSSSSTSLPPVPVTEPVPHLGRSPERDGGTASFPATGALALAGRRDRGRRVPTWVWGWPGLVLAALVVFLLALGAAFGIGRLVGSGSDAATGSSSGTVRSLSGADFTRLDAALDTTCEGHAYGRVVGFLREHPCTRLERSLWTGTVGGHAMLVTVSTVEVGDAGSAASLKSLVDATGTGNVTELVRERQYAGLPTSFSNAGYASRLLGNRVVIAQADATDASYGDVTALNRLASEGLSLP